MDTGDAVVTGPDGQAILLSKFRSHVPALVYVNTLAMHIITNHGREGASSLTGEGKYKAAACGGSHLVFPVREPLAARSPPPRRLPPYLADANTDLSED